MSVDERMRLVRMIEKMSKEPEYCKRLGIVNISRIKNGDDIPVVENRQISS